MIEGRPIIVIGAGGHAKVLIAALLESGESILGIVDRACPAPSQSIFGIPIIGDDEKLLEYPQADILLVNAVGSVSSNINRRNVFNRLGALRYRFKSVIHPSAIRSQWVSLGEGVQLMAGSVIQPATVLGNNVILNTKASIDHDCLIADHVHIAPGATLSGSVEVGEGTQIGAGAVVIQNVRIGSDCFIAAGAVVVHDVPDGTSVAGVPAKPMRRTAKETE